MILKNNLDCSNLGDSILSISTLYEFFIYFSMACKSRALATLLVVITNPLFSIQMKSAMTSDLMFFSALLILVTWVLKSFIKLLVLVVFIGTITCFHNSLLVVILRYGFGLPSPLMIFWMFSIFLLWRFGKTFLIFKVSLAVFVMTQNLRVSQWAESCIELHKRTQ